MKSIEKNYALYLRIPLRQRVDDRVSLDRVLALEDLAHVHVFLQRVRDAQAVAAGLERFARADFFFQVAEQARAVGPGAVLGVLQDRGGVSAVQRVVDRVFEDVAQAHVGRQRQLVHHLRVVGHLRAVPGYRAGNRVQAEGAVSNGLGLGLEHVAEVGEDYVQVKYARQGMLVRAGVQREICEGGVADEQVPAVHVQENRPDLQSKHGRVGKGGVADQI